MMEHALPETPVHRIRGTIPERVDVAIVGCGLGGLSAAVHLARRGKRVACFDSHYVAGGCATQFARRNRSGSFRFDVGVHYIGDCGPGGSIPRMLEELGASVEFVPLDQDGFDVLVFPDFRFRIPANVELYRERLLELFPRERRGIDRYLKLLQHLRYVASRLDASVGRPGPRVLWDIVRNGWLVLRYHRRTIQAFLESCTRDVRLRAVLLGQTGDYGLPPSEAAALAHMGLTNHYFHGAYYPKGGGQIIADKVAESAETAGATIHLRQPVERILIEHGRAVGVKIEPRHGVPHEVRADVVISNADLKRTYLELLPPEEIPARYRRRVEQYRMGGAVFMTCLGIRGDLRAHGLGAFNVWQFDSYDLERVYPQGAVREPQGCFITSSSLKDPGTTTHASPGLSNVEVMTMVPGHAQDWGAPSKDVQHWSYKRSEQYRALKERIEEDMVARLERLFPGTREAIVYRESATPLTQTRFTRASDGSGYGLALTPDQFLDRRPDYRTHIGGLYLCGASTRANHGVAGALTSGARVAEAIVADRGW